MSHNLIIKGLEDMGFACAFNAGILYAYREDSTFEINIWSRPYDFRIVQTGGDPNAAIRNKIVAYLRKKDSEVSVDVE